MRISKCAAVAKLGGAWPQSQPALEAPCVVLPVITADKLLQLRLLSPAGCQPGAPRLRHGSPFILIRGTPCVIKKSVYYCRHALTATSIIVNRQMGGGQGGCVLQLFSSTGPAGEAQEEVSPLPSLTLGPCDNRFLSKSRIFGAWTCLQGWGLRDNRCWRAIRIYPMVQGVKEASGLELASLGLGRGNPEAHLPDASWAHQGRPHSAPSEIPHPRSYLIVPQNPTAS